MSIVLEEKENVLWLPPAAIRTYQGRDFVVVQHADGSQQRVDVLVGIATDERVEIRPGWKQDRPSSANSRTCRQAASCCPPADRQNPMEPFILCENLVKIYKVSSLEVVALQGLDLVVQPGELMGIVGASGLGQEHPAQHPGRAGPSLGRAGDGQRPRPAQGVRPRRWTTTAAPRWALSGSRRPAT